MRRTRWHSLLGLAAIVGIASCAPTGTSLLLEIDLAAVPGVQQLHVTGTVDDVLVFGPAIRPEHAGDPLTGVQTLRVLLPDSTDGQTVQVRVEGLVSGEVRGTAQEEAVARKNHETKVHLALDPHDLPCTGCKGCCSEGRCISGASLSACGGGGVVCIACDPALSDQCASGGRCACGAGPACSPQTGADRCVDGACRCGNGPACPSGTECDNGVCRCTESSCAGCCSDNECLPGNDGNACGAGGVTCQTCTGGSTCNAGQCG